MDIKSIINSISKLSDSSIEELISETEHVNYSKGHILSYAGDTERYIYFLKKGIARAYVTHDGSDVTFWFGTEGSCICSMRNYIENKPSYETLELLEDCSLYRIRISSLKKLYEQNIEIANWGRKFIELELIKTEDRLIGQQFLTATERYQLLMNNSPTLFQRVSLGIIASYLGITQVSLSRIRNKK